ncbi:helix-turn-helix domain-containing protein [Roseovarius aestuariivivens]|uniref:helix-turn-helix domain-containing protein n=1 Tax=Roseovarius aestuariivivens TaxID=1888910 RepID=UPI00315AF8D1
MIGTRIRQRRVSSGLRQAELAKLAGISASYLNLIEHNRRRIGGKTLTQIAQVLEVEPASLREGAEVTLLTALREAAGARAGSSQRPAPELDRIEEFAGRFPGWAGLLAELEARRGALERTVEVLTERLAHDPQLAGALHEVISTATAIRSTAAILAETRELEPEWQMRFHRNINEDGKRLADGAEALMRYLEGGPDTGSDIKSPQDELHAFLDAHGFHFPQLEGWGAGTRVASLVENAKMLETASARVLASEVLTQYVDDARALPLDQMQRLIARHGAAPDDIADETARPLAQVFRRLAMLPEDVAGGPLGLIVADAAGAILLRKPVHDFAVPRGGAGCALWPLYEVFVQPARPVRAVLRQGDLRLEALAVAEQLRPAGFDRIGIFRAHMLLRPQTGSAESARQVGATCRVCSIPGCAARREPSILMDGL